MERGLVTDITHFRRKASDGILNDVVDCRHVVLTRSSSLRSHIEVQLERALLWFMARAILRGIAVATGILCGEVALQRRHVELRAISEVTFINAIGNDVSYGKSRRIVVGTVSSSDPMMSV